MSRYIFILPALAVLSLILPVKAEAFDKKVVLFIQAASFADYNNALVLYEKLSYMKGACLVECSLNGKKLYRIKIAAGEAGGTDIEKALRDRFNLKAIAVKGIKPGEKVIKDNSGRFPEQAMEIPPEAAASGDAGGDTALPPDTGTRQIAAPDLIKTASSFMGSPYRFGGRGEKGFDCSGLVWRSYEINGISVPRDAGKQFDAGETVRELMPGDLVFFRTYKKSISHVGIYLGDDRFIHSATGEGVKISLLSEAYYAKRYAGARCLARAQ